MGAGTGLMFLVMFIMFFMGVPIGISMMVALIVLLKVNPVTNMGFMVQALYSGLNNSSLVSLPFFILCGTIMEHTSISEKICNFAKTLIGDISGGLGLVAIIACMFFGAITGSAPATVVAIGSIMIPEMVRNGYDKYYATALMATAGSLGIIVPPSSPMVVYACANDVSVGTMFMGGFGPALVVGVVLAVLNYVYCKRRGLKGGGSHFDIKRVVVAFKDSIIALMMPIIILGGIYSGIFTATEASVVAVVYGIIVGLFIYRKITFKDIYKMYGNNMAFMGGLFLTFAPSSAMGVIFSYLKIPQAILSLFNSITTSYYIVMLIMIGILFIVGMFVSVTPIMCILSPILLPVAMQYGISPIHFGIVMVLVVGIAFITPPVALNLYASSSMTGLPLERISAANIRFLVGLVFATIVVAFFPSITLAIPRMMGLAIG
ncbi:MAG: TRAP transporter large permease [Spirochaetales bacterium]|nr:TRAP transporter large permease [Spirochaetales bacterium]